MADFPPITVTLSQAEKYFKNRLHADVWDNASETDKTKALSWACVIIQNAFLWEDSAIDAEGEWAVPVRYGVCEQALWLLKLDPTDYPAALTQGLASGSAGAVSASFSKEMVAPLVCASAISLIGTLGVLNDESAGTLKSTMLEA